jgi:predicted metal-dependent hydrolase
MARKEMTGRRGGGVIDSPAGYIVNEHPRVKHVHLKLSWQGDLEIVVPTGYDRRCLPAVIAAKHVWLERARARLLQQRQTLPSEYFEMRPRCLRLRALHRTYRVDYRATADARVTVVQSGRSLRVSGPIRDDTACARSLRAWLHTKARRRLPPWLRRTSEALGLPFARTIIRGQRSRWGSCSAQRIISLNRNLLFVPRAQVYYLFVHELSHTRHLDHSPRYWALVERKLPDYRRYELALHDAWRYVPRWAEQ